LESKGYKVIRFFNSDINKDIEAVLREILFAVGMEQDK
jgi:very-short-patch-repair endonuclease